MQNTKFTDLIGKKIIAFRGIPYKVRHSKKKECKLQYILFDDEETIMELHEQDYYTYHDCSNAAREIWIIKDKERWKQMYDKDGYDEPDKIDFIL